MTLRTTFALLLLAMALLLAAIAYLSGQLLDAQDQMAESGLRRYQSYRLADELRQSSDDLTRMARTYAVTQDERYEAWFNEILAIRNGDQARPAGCDGVFWDFVCADQRPMGKPGRKVKLQDLMTEAGFTPEELSKLRESQRRSDALVHLENAAMNALKGRFEDESGAFTIERAPDPAMARELTHGEAYHQAKAAIMVPLSEFLRLLDARTAREVAVVAARGKSLAHAVWLLALVAVAGILFTGFVVQRRVIRPVRAVADQLRDIAEGEGDLTRRVAEGRSDEVGALSRWFNVFVGRVHEVVAQTLGAMRVVESATVQIASSSMQQQAGTVELGRVTDEVAGAADEISRTADALAGTIARVSDSADTAAESAEGGRAGLRSVDQTMSRFLEAADQARAKLTTIQQRADAINEVVTTMTTVADQTNLLSINAGIEAEKAGEAGYGFRVVAEEIRRLSDQSAAATLTIEESVKAMHAAVTEGVSEMDGLSETISSGTRATAEVGAQLGRILDEVQGLRKRFDEVGDGVHQQVAGAHGIGAAMTTLRGSASETVAALRDLGAASESLRDSVGRLGVQIGRFKV